MAYATIKIVVALVVVLFDHTASAYPDPPGAALGKIAGTAIITAIDREWQNPITTGDLADDQVSNMPQSNFPVSCEERPYSNEAISAVISYAHNLQKSNSPTQKPQKSGKKPAKKPTPYPHMNDPAKGSANKINRGDFKLPNCDPGGPSFIEYPILAGGGLWTDGATDPGPDRVFFQYIDDHNAAYCGTVFHFQGKDSRSSAFELCANSNGGNLRFTPTPPICATGGCEEGPPGES